ncbi:HigA family addiction module antitoxin [Chryseobacterium artocarpi]|uniref:HigA family addiction module antitoxin n=1 Tax=Chryseobacterium artocarpi TaxID=1414727 RepID=UPI003F36B3AF
MKPLIRAIKHNTHPGEIISSQIIKPNKLTVERTAKLLGITRPTLSNIVNGKSVITPIMAIRISKVFGGNAEFWIRLQTSYDLREAEKEFKEKNIKLDKFEFA